MIIIIILKNKDLLNTYKNSTLLFFLFSHILLQVIVLKKVQVFLLNGILLTTTSLFMRTIGLSFNVYISNKIGTEAVGIYQLIMSVYSFAITLACSGIHLAATRIVSEQLAYGFETGIKKAMNKCLFYSLSMGLFSCFLLFTFSSFICSYWLHGKISTFPLEVLSFSLPFLSMSSAMNGYFSALRNVKKSVFSQMVEQFLQMYLVSCFLNFFMPKGLDSACLALVLGSTLSEMCSCFCLFLLYIHDKRKLKANLYQDTNYTKQILKISFPIAITSYIRSGLSTLKQILIPLQLEKSGMSCEYAISRYGMIHGMVMPLILFPCTFINSFSGLLIPEFSYMQAKKSYRKMEIAFEKIFKVSFMFSFLILGIFWCFSQELSSMIYQEPEIAKFVKILAPLIVLMYIDSIVDSILKGLDKQVIVMGINIVDLTVSISFIYFLLPSSGIIGYILVLYISEILNGLVSLWFLWKETHFYFDIANWLIKPFFSLLLSTFVFSILPSISTSSLIGICVKILLFCVCYFLFLYLFKAVRKEDMKI